MFFFKVVVLFFLIFSGLRRIRRPLDVLTSSLSSSQSTTSSGIFSQKSLLDSQNNGLANLCLSSPQDVFYRKRSSSQQNLSPLSINKENIKKISAEKHVNELEGNTNGVETTNDDNIDKILIPKLGGEEAAEKSKVSPYFLNNKLTVLSKISSSGYRPSGLRKRTPAVVATFPRVL